MTTERAPESGAYEWTFGDRLRKIRRVHNLTQDEFADALGVNRKSIAAWELDSWLPRGVVGFAKKLQLRYGVPVAWTLGLDEQSSGGKWAHWESNPEPAGLASNVVTGLFLQPGEWADVPDRGRPAEVLDLTAHRRQTAPTEPLQVRSANLRP